MQAERLLAVISLKIGGIIIAAFVAGAFFSPLGQEAIAAIIATDVQCTGCVGTTDLAGSAITAAKIKDGEVKAAEIASNAVTSAKIATGAVDSSDIKDDSIGSADLSQSYITHGVKADGQDGWSPSGQPTCNCDFTHSYFITNVPSAKEGSIVVLTLNRVPFSSNNAEPAVCTVSNVIVGGFTVACHRNPENNSYLDYMVINRPGI